MFQSARLTRNLTFNSFHCNRKLHRVTQFLKQVKDIEQKSFHEAITQPSLCIGIGRLWKLILNPKLINPLERPGEGSLLSRG